MKSPGRYLSAFVRALRMTLRGERIPTPEEQLAARFPKLARWLQETARLVEQAEQTAAAQSVNPEAFTMHVEGRDVTMATILKAVAYHARTEYPHLFLNEGQYARLALTATNLNDAFLVRRLADSPDLPVPLKPGLEALHQHLVVVPNEDN